MNISDEAVEAAAKAMWQRTRIDPWENNTDHLAVEVHRHEARLALEAAAPYMLAPCAVEDCDGSTDCASPGHIEGCFSTNPDYRSQA